MRRKPLALFALLVLGSQGCGKPQSPTMAAAVAALEQTSSVRELRAEPGQEIKHFQSVDSPTLHTEKFQHFFRGIEVLGSSVYVHLSTFGSEVLDRLAHFDLKIRPTLSVDQAVSIALALEPDTTLEQKPALKIFPSWKTRTARLIYSIELGARDSYHKKTIWINAHSGQHIATLTDEYDFDFFHNKEIPRVENKTARGQGQIIVPKLVSGKPTSCSINPLSFTGFQVEPLIVDGPACLARVTNSCQTLDPNGNPTVLHPDFCPKAEEADDSAQRAADNARKFLSYFRNVHGRNSFDDQGSPILSLVHVGLSYTNATWYGSGNFVAYGDGNEQIRDSTFAIDVAGHELTHGVIQHSAGLRQIGETGALNESIADFFGKVIEDRNDWGMGRGLLISSEDTPSRDLSEPGKVMGSYLDAANERQMRPYPATYAQGAPIVEPCTKKNDLCSIHFNSTVPGHAWYLIHQKIGKQAAEALIYLTLTQFLGDLSDFEEAANATLRACSKILGAEDCTRVKAAFIETGILR